MRNNDGKLDQIVISNSENTNKNLNINNMEETMLDLIVQTSMDGFWLVDVDSKILEVNDTYCKMSGYTREEILTMKIADFEAIEEQNEIIDHIQKIINLGQDRFESIHRRKDGTFMNIETSVQYKNINGFKCIAFLRDITERKLAEENIKKLNRFYLVLSKVNKSIIRCIDKKELFKNVCKILVEDGSFLMSWIGFVNPKTYKVDIAESFGRIGDYLENIDIDMNDPIRSSGPTGKSIRTGVVHFSSFIQIDHAMTPWRERALKLGYKSSISLPLRVFGEIIGAFTLYSGEVDFFNEEEISLLEKLAYDISFAIEYIEKEEERKQNEELLKIKNIELKAQYDKYLQLNEILMTTNHDLEIQKKRAEESDKLKTSFLQNMSHEIRTPLNGILGFSALLQDQDNSKEEIEEYTGIIQQSGKRLLEIVNNILDISKIETGQLNVVNQEFCIHTLCKSLHVFFAPAAQSKNLDLKFVNKEETICLVKSDESKVNQILVNLINNAIKFTSYGAIEFGYVNTNNSLLIFVKDSGIGIEKEHFDKIFDRFIQIDQQLNKNYEGAGLGLAICKGLADLISAKIYLESEIGKGSTFYLELPKGN